MKATTIMELCGALIISGIFMLGAEYSVIPNSCADFYLNDQIKYDVCSDMVGSESDEMELPKVEPESGHFLNSLQSWQLPQQCL